MIPTLILLLNVTALNFWFNAWRAVKKDKWSNLNVTMEKSFEKKNEYRNIRETE